ncbi:MAG TPA: hypothetical protein VN812_02825 [Candidatus Acidoferrales bacterium]|nr:hypothetical protein [Candidatus Acidoferrales bacterium]
MRHVIVCATDAGGARNLAPLLPVLVRRGTGPIVMTCRAHRELFQANATCDVILTDDGQPRDLDQLVADTQPAAIICGTTRYASPDRELTARARGRVRTVAVLDEWYNYRLRFENADSGDLAYLPDAVAVQDEQARSEAAAEGIPAGVCHVTGSPALADLTRRAQALAESPPPVPPCLDGVGDRPVVTFLSETHAADYGTSPEAPGTLGPFIGYTENSVRDAIVEMCSRLQRPVTVIEKLHPAAQEYAAPVVSRDVDWRPLRRTDLWALLWHSDVVIGMRSMALLEADILGCEAVSFQPGLIGPERCTAVRLGLIPKLDRPRDLEAWCAQRLATQRRAVRVIRRHRFALPDAAERVVDLALGALLEISAPRVPLPPGEVR